jgi:hypothetical protein
VDPRHLDTLVDQEDLAALVVDREDSMKEEKVGNNHNRRHTMDRTLYILYDYILIM